MARGSFLGRRRGGDGGGRGGDEHIPAADPPGVRADAEGGWVGSGVDRSPRYRGEGEDRGGSEGVRGELPLDVREGQGGHLWREEELHAAAHGGGADGGTAGCALRVRGDQPGRERA